MRIPVVALSITLGLFLGDGLFIPDVVSAALNAGTVLTGIAIAASEPRVVITAPQPYIYPQPQVVYTPTLNPVVYPTYVTGQDRADYVHARNQARKEARRQAEGPPWLRFDPNTPKY